MTDVQHDSVGSDELDPVGSGKVGQGGSGSQLHAFPAIGVRGDELRSGGHLLHLKLSVFQGKKPGIFRNGDGALRAHPAGKLPVPQREFPAGRQLDIVDVAAAFRLQERPVDGMSGRVEKRPYPLPAGGEPVGVDAVADGIDQRFQFAEVEGVVVVEQQRADVIGVFAGIVDADRVPQPQIPRGGFVVATSSMISKSLQFLK